MSGMLPHTHIPTGAGGTLAGLADSHDAERLSRYRSYLEFYDGIQWDARRRAGETRLVWNYARTLLRKGVSYLFTTDTGHNVLTDQGKEPAQAEEVEGLLSEVYAANDIHTLDWQAGLDAAVVGDFAQKVTWSKRLRRPVVSNVDPQGLWVWWYPDNPREIYRVLHKFTVSQEEAQLIYGVDLLGAELPASRERTVVVVEEWRRDRFSVEVGGQLVVDGAVNPYGWIPYIVAPNTARPHEFWGASDLEDLFDVCRELNRRTTALSRILTVSGYPITVLENVDKSDAIRAEAGAIWELPEDSRAYLLNLLEGGVELHVQFIETIYRALHDLSETPRTAFGDSGRTLSGVALEVEIQPLVQKVQRKRRVWDRVYRERNRMLLDLTERFGGKPTYGLRRTAPVWGSILPSDREALVRDEVQLVAARVHSIKQAMGVLGEQDAVARFAEVIGEMQAIGEMAARYERRNDGDDGDDSGEGQDAAGGGSGGGVD